MSNLVHSVILGLLAICATSGLSQSSPSEPSTGCSAASALGIPDYMPASVMAAEKILNMGLKDSIEDQFLRIRLSDKDVQWWDRWAAQAEVEAASAVTLRAKFGKWPASAALTGYVLSYGPAQITPFAALPACRNEGRMLNACRGGVRKIISNLLEKDSASAIAAAVLAHERTTYCELIYAKSCAFDATMLANLYNYGAAIYFLDHGQSVVKNRFSEWVVGHIQRCPR
jgi:hypothetical protein